MKSEAHDPLAYMLKKAGLKVTSARRAILHILSTSLKPIDAERIWNTLKAEKIDQATIYRNLMSLEKAGIITRVDIHRDSVHYELAGRHHHHMICTDCGAIEDFQMCDVEKATKTALKKSSFKSISAHSFELFGTCKKCARV